MSIRVRASAHGAKGHRIDHSHRIDRGEPIEIYLVSASASQLVVKKGKEEMFYLTTHSTHFIYGYMASDIW